MTEILKWIESNINALTLFVTLIIVIITLISIWISLKALKLSSQSIIKIETTGISLYPEIKFEHENKEIIIEKDKRYCINIDLLLSNITDKPVQNIIIDGLVKFKKRKPCGHNKLPAHIYESRDFLMMNDKAVKCAVRFDNFIAKEIIQDFYEGRKSKEYAGFPYLPTDLNDKRKIYWPSPLLIVKVFYYDLQGQEYVSEKKCVFHIWGDSDNEKLGIYLTNMNSVGFTNIKKLRRKSIIRYLNGMRTKRLSSFDGKKYKKREMPILVLAKNNEE